MKTQIGGILNPMVDLTYSSIKSGKDMNKRIEKKKAKKEKEELELVIPEPDTESVPPSPITGQTADLSKESPGQ